MTTDEPEGHDRNPSMAKPAPNETTVDLTQQNTPSLNADGEALPARPRRSWSRLAIWGFAFAFFVYMIVLPTTGWVINRFNPPELSGEIEDMSLNEFMRARSVEVISALIFFVFGATVGSFLNVVVYRLPRGKSVFFRRSRCPDCVTPIQGRDNIPILGWLLLNGRCRACDRPIAGRYPMVELLTGSLFLLLYFIELLSGGQNIPERLPNFHRGITWILLFPKWDLIGLYFFHGLSISILITAMLIDIDRQRISLIAKAGIASLLLIPGVVWPDLLPIPFIDAAQRWAISPWLLGTLQCSIGGVVAGAIGWGTLLGISSCRISKPVGQIPTFSVILGISFGWQAALTIVIFGLALRLITMPVAQKRAGSHLLTVNLFLATVIHLVIWRQAIEFGGSWWPGHNTSVLGWIMIAVVFVSLIVANRKLAERLESSKATHEPPIDDEAELSEETIGANANPSHHTPDSM